jgi:hypothetical protein
MRPKWLFFLDSNWGLLYIPELKNQIIAGKLSFAWESTARFRPDSAGAGVRDINY